MSISLDIRVYASNASKRKASLQTCSVSPAPDALGYALRFYASGSSVDDRTTILYHYKESDWPAIAGRLGLLHFSEAASDPGFDHAVCWLMGGDDGERLTDARCR
jgi:hypothetical protein